jgi:5-methylcytosine-specific restriction endonuclease McrA
MQLHTREYVQYLRSREWQAKRLAALHRTMNRCEKCGLQKHKESLEVHHKTYERLGHELDSDLMVLCTLCHPKEDEVRRAETANRVYDRRLDGWASKKYGDEWYDYMPSEFVEQEFEEWLERNQD